MSLATVQHSTALPSTKVDTGPRYAPDPQIKSPAKQDTQLPVSSPPPTWLADVNAQSRVENSVNAFLDTLDPALKKLIKEDIQYAGGFQNSYPLSLLKQTL